MSSPRKPGIIASANVLSPGGRGQAEVPEELEEVRRRLARQDALHDVLVLRIALALGLKEREAWLGAEDELLALVYEHLGAVALGSAGAEHHLAKVAESDRRRAVRVPLDAGSGLAPALGHLLPNGVEGFPRARVLLAQPGTLGRPGEREVEPDG